MKLPGSSWTVFMVLESVPY